MMRARLCAVTGLLVLALGVSAVRAQSPAGPPPPENQQTDGPGGGHWPPHSHEHSRDHGQDGPPPPGGSAGSTMRGGLQLGPPGRWWDNPYFVDSLHLRADQQTRMDAIFAQNKNTLMARFDTLRDEERQLATLSRGANIDEHALFAHIDRVTQARAELEKANAHMLLTLRHELSPEQITALDEQRPQPR